MEELQKKYPKETAGAILTTSVLKARKDEKISDVHERLNSEIKDIRTVNYVYVVDDENKLIGVFSIRDVFSQKEKFVRDVMRTHPVTVSPMTHQEKVAHLALRHNIKMVPVVDNGYFLGAVPSDKILSVINKEAHEDILHFGGVHKEHLEFENILEVPLLTGIKHRIPWLLIGLFGGIFAAKIIGVFENTLEKNLILAMFLPLIVYISNAVGTQIQTVYIRDLSITEKIPLKRYILKHVSLTVPIALIFSIIFFLASFLIWSLTYIGFVISLSMFFTILMGAFIALFIPYILKKFNFDPALGSGPFATIIQDISSIIIYFAISSVLL